jgi:Ca2+-binding EF-hand superfamily protein
MKNYRLLALVTVLGVAASLPALAAQSGARDRQAQTRFRGMDADGDGVITRAEWRGGDQAFRQQDRNRDGVLSGTEIRGVVAQSPQSPQSPSGPDDEVRRQQAAATNARILSMDTDKDGVITRAEWRDDTQAFQQQDRNRDGVLSGAEVRALSFQDRDRDGVITRAEWQGDVQAFREQDRNRDGVLSGIEVRALLNSSETPEETRRRQALAARFNRADRNRDSQLTREEWTGQPRAFARMDTNRDGLVTRAEFVAANTESPAATSGERPPTPSYQAGYDKGMTEGRQAGKGDRSANRGWDLEGQR